MIEMLNGIRETVVYKKIESFLLFDNKDFEAYPDHWHTPIEIIMPLENPYQISCRDSASSYILQEGDLLIINSGVIHSMPAMPGERLIFQADFSLLHSMTDIASILSNIPSALLITSENAPTIHEQLKTLMLDICKEYFSDSILTSASIYSKLIKMLVLIGRECTINTAAFDVTRSKQQEYTEKFIAVCNHIEEHCTEDLSLDDAAALAGFSKYHFTRLFKQFTGVSFYKYLNRKRIEHAEMLLVDPEISIAEVALQSGFSSLSTFIRMFKLIKDCTPTEFRNLYEG